MLITMKKSERHSLILKRARQYASSGKFRTFRDIESQIRFVDGLPEARQVLDISNLRRELEEACKRSCQPDLKDRSAPPT